MLKASKRGVLWPTRVCQVAWCSWRAPKDWQTGVVIPTQKMETECTNYCGFPSVPWISVCQVPWKKYRDERWNNLTKLGWYPSVVFFLVAGLQIKCSLQRSIFEKSWEYAEDVHTYFVDLVKSLGVLREYGVDGRLLLAVNLLHSCSEDCVRVDGVKITTVHRCCWTPTRCVLSPLLFIVYELDRQTQPGGRGCHCWKLQDQLFADGLVLNRVSHIHFIGLQMRTSRPRCKSALKGPTYYVSPETKGSVRCT